VAREAGDRVRATVAAALLVVTRGGAREGGGEGPEAALDALARGGGIKELVDLVGL
jgi:hypothetical protein